MSAFQVHSNLKSCTDPFGPKPVHWSIAGRINMLALVLSVTVSPSVFPYSCDPVCPSVFNAFRFRGSIRRWPKSVILVFCRVSSKINSVSRWPLRRAVCSNGCLGLWVNMLSQRFFPPLWQTQNVLMAKGTTMTETTWILFLFRDLDCFIVTKFFQMESAWFINIFCLALFSAQIQGWLNSTK